jgi:hypothetical protein
VQIGARRAIVVFEHRAARGPLRWLAPGFRHCFCLLDTVHSGWLLCDPLKGSLRLDVLPAVEIGVLVEHYVGTGRHVAVGPARSATADQAGWPVMLTCVELVKRAIGLHAPRTFTPWRLFLELRRQPGWAVARPGMPLDREPE